MLVPLNSAGIFIAAAPTSDFFSSQLFGIIIGGIISAVTTLLVSFVLYKQQRHRDQDAHDRQVEREQVVYIRSLKAEKRERLRSAYKVVLHAAEEYHAVLHELGVVYQGETKETRDTRLNASLKAAQANLNEVMVELTLEDVGVDVIRIFDELRKAFYSYTYGLDTNTQVPNSFSFEDLMKDKEAVKIKLEELKTTMKWHLKELEQ